MLPGVSKANNMMNQTKVGFGLNQGKLTSNQQMMGKTMQGNNFMKNVRGSNGGQGNNSFQAY